MALRVKATLLGKANHSRKDSKQAKTIKNKQTKASYDAAIETNHYHAKLPESSVRS